MRRFFSLSIITLLCSTTIFSETTKKTIIIDNLYKIEQTYDDSKKILNLNLTSDNSAPFDEQYAESSIEEALNDFINENELRSFELLSSKIDFKYNNEKYTSLKKQYRIE